MINDVEHLFVHLLAISIFFLMDFFMSFVHSNFFYALCLSCGMQDLVPGPGVEPLTMPPALGAWSLNRWAIREGPLLPIFQLYSSGSFLYILDKSFIKYVVCKYFLLVACFFNLFTEYFAEEKLKISLNCVYFSISQSILP